MALMQYTDPQTGAIETEDVPDSLVAHYSSIPGFSVVGPTGGQAAALTAPERLTWMRPAGSIAGGLAGQLVAPGPVGWIGGSAAGQGGAEALREQILEQKLDPGAIAREAGWGAAWGAIPPGLAAAGKLARGVKAAGPAAEAAAELAGHAVPGARNVLWVGRLVNAARGAIGGAGEVAPRAAGEVAPQAAEVVRPPVAATPPAAPAPGPVSPTGVLHLPGQGEASSPELARRAAAMEEALRLAAQRRAAAAAGEVPMGPLERAAARKAAQMAAEAAQAQDFGAMMALENEMRRRRIPMVERVALRRLATQPRGGPQQ